MLTLRCGFLVLPFVNPKSGEGSKVKSGRKSLNVFTGSIFGATKEHRAHKEVRALRFKLNLPIQVIELETL